MPSRFGGLCFSRSLDFEILHTCIDPAWSWLECNQSFCTDVCTLWWAPSLTYILHSVELHLVKRKKKYPPPPFFSPSELRHHHLVSIHLLIAGGHGDQLGLALCLAFLMPLCFKRGPCKILSAFATPPRNIPVFLRQHSQEVKSTHQRKGEAAHEGFFWDLSFLYHYDYMSTLCPLPSVLYSTSPL